uniref:Uncharacterized protein n=1 Tax=Cannabis sativa TaxID=3483 RepID=A0A803Q2Y6_CANSA
MVESRGDQGGKTPPYPCGCSRGQGGFHTGSYENSPQAPQDRVPQENASSLFGSPNVRKVELWLTMINRILNFMGVTENDRVTSATF